MNCPAPMTQKRKHGRYYTRASPFSLPPFLEWAKEINLPRRLVLEPFAGQGGLVDMLRAAGLCRRFRSYDAHPAATDVARRDTIRDFPTGFSVCITNPPWLARNSAARRGLSYPSTIFDDLYKHCLKLCLRNCEYVGALLPASFLQSGLFRGRLSRYILLHSLPFTDTENPVCLALFNPSETDDALIYYDDDFVGKLRELEEYLPDGRSENVELRFNDPDGRLGFVAFDNTATASIRFCLAEEIRGCQIKHTSRFITRIGGDFEVSNSLVSRLNGELGRLRGKTRDVFLTPFKGLRADGDYRRRMSFGLARGLLLNVT